MARRLLSSHTLSIDSERSTWPVVAKLLGEFLREMAVLIIVFAPLDMIVQGKPLTGQFALATMTIVTLLLGVGVALEVKQWKTS